MHEFDPGFTGLSVRCNKLVLDDRGYGTECGRLISDAVHFQRKAECVGCLTGHDIGLPSSEVAYAHPECPVHGDTEDVPLTAEEEEMLPADPVREAYREFDRIDATLLGMEAMSRLAKGLDVPRSLIEGDWPMKRVECLHNPGVSCAEVMRRGNGHCCEEYDRDIRRDAGDRP